MVKELYILVPWDIMKDSLLMDKQIKTNKEYFIYIMTKVKLNHFLHFLFCFKNSKWHELQLQREPIV